MRKTIIVLIVFLLTSCKDEVPTDGEQIANTIKALVTKHNIKEADIYVGNYQNHNNIAFSFESSFIKVEPTVGNMQYYNLTTLVTFNINESTDGNTIALLFSI